MNRIDFEDIHIEVADADAPERMTWFDAMRWSRDLGDGWGLPTIDELYLMYIARERIGGFVSDDYWSSSDDGDYSDALYQDFVSGRQYYCYKGSYAQVRVVREVAP